MYHVGRPGRGRLREPRAAGLGPRRPQQPHERLLVVGAARTFPVDRRRSAVARLRQRADDPAALVAPRDRATTSTRTRSGSSKASPSGATLIVIDPRLSNTSAKADMWLPAQSGHRRRRCCSRWRGILLDDGAATTASSSQLGELGDVPRGALARAAADVRELRVALLKEEYAQFTPEYAEIETGVPARQDRSRPREAIGARGHRVLHAQLARGGVRQPLGLADHALPLPARRADGRDRRAGRREPALDEQVRPEAPESAAAARLLERAAVPEGVPARVLRDELPAAALPQGRARQARRLLHARLQPAVDESRRLLVDGSAAGRGEDRHARRADADLERDGVVRRLRAADGPRHRAPRHDEPGDARRAAGSGFRQPVHARGAGEAAASRSTLTHEAEPRRSVGGSRVLGRALAGRSIPTARSASASTSSRRTGPASRSRWTSTTDGCSRTPCPGLPEAAAKEDLTPLQYMRKYGVFKVDDKAYSRGARDSAVDERPTAPGVDVSTACARAGFNTPSRKLEFYSPTLAEWGWPEHAIPRYVPGHVHWRDLERAAGRVRPAAELPAADADPHALAGEVAVRDLARQPALDRDRGRGDARHRDRRPREGAHADRLLRHARLGHRGHPARRRRHVAPPRALAAERGRGRRARRVGARAHRRQTAGRYKMRQVHGAQPFESSDPDSARVWWSESRRAPEPDVPGAARSGERHALLAPARARSRRPARTIATATSSSTPNESHRLYKEWMAKTRPAPGPDGTRRPMWFDRPLRPTAKAYKI